MAVGHQQLYHKMKLGKTIVTAFEAACALLVKLPIVYFEVKCRIYFLSHTEKRNVLNIKKFCVRNLIKYFAMSLHIST